MEEELGDCLHLKFMQIETAFQEHQLQLLKINDNFLKLQRILGDDCDFEPIEIESMFEFTSGIIEDIQNRIFLHKSKLSKASKSEEETSIRKSLKEQSKVSSNKDEISWLMKNSSPSKSESPLKDNTTSDFKSNKETTEDDRGYEVINAKEFHKANEFNQFESLKDQAPKIEKPTNSPVHAKSNSQAKTKLQDLGSTAKPPSMQTSRQPNIAGSRIPGVTKPNSVARTNTLPPQEETKKHKGKTPSFGNTNAPLFLNNVNIETSEINSGANTPSYTKAEENKFDRKTFSKPPNNNLVDKFTAPVLSHREVKKSSGKNTARVPVRERQLSKKTSPNLTKEISFPPANQKPSLVNKSNLHISILYRKGNDCWKEGDNRSKKCEERTRR